MPLFRSVPFFPGVKARWVQSRPEGILTTPVLKNNAGTVLASESSVIVNVYDASTAVLIVQKTGQVSDGSGVITISSPLIFPGTVYSYEVVLATNGRRLPVATAT